GPGRRLLARIRPGTHRSPDRGGGPRASRATRVCCRDGDTVQIGWVTMGFGDGADDTALQSAWAEFCAQLQRAGERVFKDATPAAGTHRVDAYRFLTQNLG